MSVSLVKHGGLKLGGLAAAVAAVAGSVSLFGTYWDDAWHTDLGRDSAWAPPHLALYGGVAVVGVVIAMWGIRTLIATRSLRRALRHGPLTLTGAAGAVVLAAAPADAWWHTTFGRDAVLWSPPHILVVFGSIALIVGLIAGLAPTIAPLWPAALGALLIGDLLVAVMEYDTDVPQFSDWWYLPVLLAGGVIGAEVVRRLAPAARWPVTGAVLLYVALRLTVMAVLAALGHSTPDLPIAVIGLCVADLPWQRPTSRVLASATAMAMLAWLAAVAGVSSVGARPVGVIAGGVGAVWAVTALAQRLHRPVGVAVLLLAIGLGAGALVQPRPAVAHDPGQGEVLQTVQVVATSDGRGGLTLTVRAGRDCGRLQPVAVQARRGGKIRSAPLTLAAPCQLSGTVRVPADGRWFLYAALHHDGRPAEVWVPMTSNRRTNLDQQRVLYQLPERTGNPSGKYVAGGGLYLIGLILLGSAMTLVVRRNRRIPTSEPDTKS
jgi:hypothetical protein